MKILKRVLVGLAALLGIGVVVRVFNQGVGKSGRVLYGMPWPYYGGMVEEDKRALIAAPTFKP